MTETPWPRVRTGGELELAGREWLHTNGAGAYAMSTLGFMHTRRQHGLLVAALSPPIGRHVMLSHADVTVEARGRVHRLASHRFPGTAPMPGYRFLEAFAQDPIPRWTYRLDRTPFEQTLCFAPGRNAIVLGFAWGGRGPAKLSVRPLMSGRPVGSLVSGRPARMEAIAVGRGSVEVQPVRALPPLLFGHDGLFLGAPDWWRRLEYSEEQKRGVDAEENLWTPGVFERSLEPGETVRLVVAVDALPTESAEELEEEASANLRWADPGGTRSGSVRALSVAASSYCVDSGKRPGIIAGYPDRAVCTRELLMALPGLYLVRGQDEAARRLVSSLLDHVDGLRFETGIHEGGGSDLGGSDVPLWFLEAARHLVARLGPRDDFVKSRVYPAAQRVFESVVVPVGRGDLWLDEAGLLVCSGSTWMGPGNERRRSGLAIEHQALWSKGCETIADLAYAYQHAELALDAERNCRKVRETFIDAFWCNETSYPFDAISETRGGGDAWADSSVRPNALLALAVDPDLFDEDRARTVLDRAQKDLLTPRGLRTLSRSDPRYVGKRTSDALDPGAYADSGAAWPFLLGAYVRASLNFRKDEPKLRSKLKRAVERAIDDWPVLGQVGQAADGSSPHRAALGPSHALAVAELLRTLVWDLGL